MLSQPIDLGEKMPPTTFRLTRRAKYALEIVARRRAHSMAAVLETLIRQMIVQEGITDEELCLRFD